MHGAQDQDRDEVIIYGSPSYDRWLMVVLLIGFLAMLSGLRTIGIQATVGSLEGLGLMLGAVLTGAGALRVIRRVRDRKPRITVSKVRLIDQTGLFSDRIEVPWNQVTNIRRGPGPFIRIDVADPDALFSQMGPLDVLVRRANHMFGGAPVTIIAAGLDRGASEVARLIEEHEAQAALASLGHDGRALPGGSVRPS